MSRFRLDDFPLLETAPTSAAALRTKLGEMLISSTSARVRIEAVNPQTGEYRIVLQGTIDTEKTPFDVT
ncbi:MAG: hypothetical protein DMF52_03210 [Acidobacteria bacterium]|nr:MAG: hypothetical protein AUG03_03775 [Acidobacteria bacterium 13_1_20CM_2_68_14]PYT37433.1 MAG: hypothetical protein DMF52_03210 [Acidobacteriota bacterium]